MLLLDWKDKSTYLFLKSNKSIQCRRNLTSCAFCNNAEETSSHLFFECSFARGIWFGSPLGAKITSLTNLTGKQILEWLLKEHSQTQNNCGLFSLVGCILQAIWKARNDYIFRGSTPNPIAVVNQAVSLNAELEQVQIRVQNRRFFHH